VTTWRAPGGTLGLIVAEAELRVARLRDPQVWSRLDAASRASAAPPPFAAVLRRPWVSVIAEVKRRSPSKGVINEGLVPAEQARAYAIGGAVALSVLTEPDHFGGSPDDLNAVRSVLTLPLLKKDFHIDPVQLLEARACGASAALLIVRALAPDRLATMVAAAREYGVEVLLEVRDESELDRALAAGATLIGVNNRDLESLRIDMGTMQRLIPLIPAACIAVAESGIASVTDVGAAAACGADAVLVGSSVSAAPDPAAAVRALTATPRCQRGS
jgi:indole-3-glycerol phosphate synthase